MNKVIIRTKIFKKMSRKQPQVKSSFYPSFLPYFNIYILTGFNKIMQFAQFLIYF